MAKTQKAVEFAVSTEHKDWRNKLYLTTQKPIPTVGHDEVLIRMNCRSVNPLDLMAISGTFHGYNPICDPATPGFDGMGTVDKVGSSVKNFKVGQRVVPYLEMGLLGNGSWQEYMKVREDQLFHVPDAMSDEVAAQLFINACTVVGLMDTLKCPPGEFVIQSGAGSTVGRMFASYAKQLDVKTINIVRGTHRVESLKSLGADWVIDSETDDVIQRVKDITGGKLACCAIDAVVGNMTKTLTHCVRDNGFVVIFGNLSGMEGTYSVNDVLFRGVTLKGFYSIEWLESFKAENKFHDLIQRVMKMLMDGSMKPTIGKKFNLDDFTYAVEESMMPKKEGKVFIVG